MQSLAHHALVHGLYIVLYVIMCLMFIVDHPQIVSSSPTIGFITHLKEHDLTKDLKSPI